MRWLVVLFGSVLVCSCSSDESTRPTPPIPPAPPATAAAVKIQTPPTQSLIINDTLKLNAVVSDSAGHPIAGKSVTWTVSPSQAEFEPGTATIDPQGRIVGVKGGWVWARASVDAQADSVELYVRAHAIFSLPVPSATVAAGAATSITVPVHDSTGAPFRSPIVPFSVTSSDSTIVGVANLMPTPLAFMSGIAFDLQGKRAGDATITVTVDSVTKTFGVHVFTVSFTSVVTANGFVGTTFTCGLAADASALCWGENQWGQLGSPTPKACRGSAGQYCATYGPSSTPLPVQGNLKFRSLSLGGSDACGITLTDDAYCWGNGGSLGSNATLGSCSDGGYYNDAGGACSASPVPVAGQIKFRGLAVTSGQVCGVARTTAGYCWGLGVSALPTPVAPGFAFDTIVPGYEAPTCGLMSDGQTYCWSSGSFGQTPAHVDGIPALSEIGASGSIDCGLSQSGQVYCWASDLKATLVPTDQRFVSLSVGYTSACGLTDAGIAYCWDVDTPSTTPTAVASTATGPLPLSSIRTGYPQRWCGMGRDGVAYCGWGAGAPGRVPGQP